MDDSIGKLGSTLFHGHVLKFMPPDTGLQRVQASEGVDLGKLKSPDVWILENPTRKMRSCPTRPWAFSKNSPTAYLPTTALASPPFADRSSPPPLP